MKKILAFLMVLVLALSFGVTASVSAEENGSITITNATIDQTYKIYKIFDATITVNAASTTADGIAYSIAPDNQFFTALFGADGTTDNNFFNYNSNTGSVTKKDGVNDTDLIKYLTEMVKNGSYATQVAPVVATSKTVKFDNIPYGYYLITSTLGVAVSINSNTPDVNVIDKNQEPAPDFDKQVQVGVDENGDPIWEDANSASIGDEITYKISFTATNYDGDKKIKYYQVHDEKGDAIWAEFNSFKVFVDGVELKKGYYLSQGGINTNNWDFLGDWSNVPEDKKNRDNADWYLVHLGYDKFRITIPWLSGHSIEDVKDSAGNVISYNLNFTDDADSKFNSPVEVVVTYDAAIEANAAIGGTTHGNRFNKAYASWTSEHDSGSTPPDEVVTNVYGLGLLKDDKNTGENLAGAKFRIYSDEACTKPVYVIPTDIDGVYMIDSYNTPIATISGSHRVASRDLYAAYLAEYLGSNVQDNYVISQINGKLVILGLKAGTYYLREVEPPKGYNALSLPVEVVVGEGTRPFVIFADANGNVADIHTEDATHTEYRYDITQTTVHNSKGVELPSTGGQGTFWFITIGTLLAIAFAAFLITHKKMSVYTD